MHRLKCRLLYNLKGAAALNHSACPSGAKVSADVLIGTSIVVADPLTLKLALEAPAGYFLASLTYPTSWAVPKALIEQYADKWTDHLAENGGFGGNLFKLTRWDHQGHLGFERNERFWGQKSTLKEIHYTLFKEIGVAWAAYKAGEGDANPAVIAQELDIAKTMKGSIFKRAPQLALSYLMLNWTRPPFDDVRVREAFSLALDRQAIAHDVFQDSVQPTIHFLPEGLPGYNSYLQDPIGRRGKEALTADLAAAQRLASEYAAEKCGGIFAKCPPIEYSVPYVRPARCSSCERAS